MYCIPAGWIWGSHGFLKGLGAIDIGGSGAVHLIGGSSGLFKDFLPLLEKLKIIHPAGTYRKTAWSRKLTFYLCVVSSYRFHMKWAKLWLSPCTKVLLFIAIHYVIFVETVGGIDWILMLIQSWSWFFTFWISCSLVTCISLVRLFPWWNWISFEVCCKKRIFDWTWSLLYGWCSWFRNWITSSFEVISTRRSIWHNF